MPESDIEKLRFAIQRRWPGEPSPKAMRHITSFFNQTRTASAIKTSELRNRYFKELGAMKLACLWVLEHFGNGGSS